MTDNLPWFKSWFGSEYLEVYSHRTLVEAQSQVSFICGQIDPAPDWQILDMTCGAGRHMRAFKEAGFLNAIGADLSTELLKETRELLGLDTRLIQYDMRHFPFRDKSFDLILNFFTSFGYFRSEKENHQVLKNVSLALKDGGHFVFDYMNPVKILNQLVLSRTKEIEDGTILEKRSYDSKTKRVENKILINRGGKRNEYLESVRVYQLEELDKLFQDAGLSITNRFGDFDGSKFCADSKRLIIFARR